MEFKYFSHNGEVRPIDEAAVSLSNIEYQYGFGVYETIRVTNGIAYFLAEHLERLIASAHEIGLEHPFSTTDMEGFVRELIEKNEVEVCNLKILLIGGKEKQHASLFIQCLNPLFPDKKLYRDGAHCITARYERMFPHAKTLNMLGSYLAYRKAQQAGAYDALLIDSEGRITEGTRTNFFCMNGKTIYSPKASDILLGVTRTVLARVAKEHGYTMDERDIHLEDLSQYECAFITSTSTKIMPLGSIDAHTFGSQPLALKQLISAFDTFLDQSAGVL